MSRKLILALLLLCLSLPVVAQNLGDQASAGFTNARTYANVDVPNLRPPLRLFGTLDLTGMTNANSLAVFENQFLVGQPGSPITYMLFNRNGDSLWTQTLVGSGGNFRFVPAFSSSIVILGGESTTSVKAVKISDGSVLWSDMVGNTTGRYPAVTDNYAIYAGANKIVVRELTGNVFLQLDLTTAASALAVRDDSLYFLSQDRKLRALNLATKGTKWGPVDNVAGAGASLIAAGKYVFVNDPTTGILAAFNAADGTISWVHSGGPESAGTFATDPALALASGRLFVFQAHDSDGDAAVSAWDADTGDQLWVIKEPSAGLSDAFIADNTVYYYHAGQIRARDAATGVLLWSIAKPDVRALSAAKGELYVLLKDSLEGYAPTNEIFMAQMAVGSGQTTLIMLANPNPRPVNAAVDFYGDDGASVPVPLKSFGTKSHLEVTVPANGSLGIQSLDQGGALISGWVRVVSDEPIRGTTDFQFTSGQEIVAEAGVADSLPTGSATVFIAVGGAFNAGVAMANPTEEDAEVTLRLLNSSGDELASKPVTVVSGGHVAKFVNEFFSDEVGTSFEGSLVIESQVPVVATAIRTKNGIQLSSYPVGQQVR